MGDRWRRLGYEILQNNFILIRNHGFAHDFWDVTTFTVYVIDCGIITIIKTTGEFRNMSVTLPQQGCICHESRCCGGLHTAAGCRAWHGYWLVRLSVSLSVCHTRALRLIQRTYGRYFYTIWKGNPSSFLPPNSGWWATSPSTFLPPLMGNWSDPPPSKIAYVDRFPPVTSQQ